MYVYVWMRINVDITASVDTTASICFEYSGQVHVFVHAAINAVKMTCTIVCLMDVLVLGVSGHVGVAELLMQAGADTSLEMSGMTALDIAKDFGHFRICNLLTDVKRSSGKSGELENG